MEEMERRCPVCGAKVIGRSDKKYCCDECRVYAGNQRGKKARDSMHKNPQIGAIEQNLLLMNTEKGLKYIKLICTLTKFCKIMYTFEHQKKDT